MKSVGDIYIAAIEKERAKNKRKPPKGKRPSVAQLHRCFHDRFMKRRWHKSSDCIGIEGP